ncbi:unnamed protein product [Clonostachys byssicola]|uniref:G domain-containing protein n=1 Tax=Clonostachys byssicola TaxID=160290 RepID=A0A9N9UHB7_9HYPO|nr:unnamed protein product [Clonostachys byssicola]
MNSSSSRRVATMDRHSVLGLSDPPGPNPAIFRGGRAPKPNDVFIAIMGVTGSGKSSFISQCCGRMVRVGHDLTGCTSTVDVHAFDLSPTQTIYLIDTPGFDDTNRGDAEVLTQIAAWLGESYQHKILLHGIVYLHPITDRRMLGSARRNLNVFIKLCGFDALQKVVLATTMWDIADQEIAENRERELIETEEFWGWMKSQGCMVSRHDHTTKSAVRIIRQLARHNEPVVTDLQRELVEQNLPLNETSAGQKIQSELLAERDKLAGISRDMEAHLRQAIKEGNAAAVAMFSEEREKYADEIRKLEMEITNLRITVEKLIDKDHRRRHTVDHSIPTTVIHRQSLDEDTQARLAERELPPTPPRASLSETQPRQFQQPQLKGVSQAVRMPPRNSDTSVSMWGDVVCIIGDVALSSTQYPRLKLDSDSAFLRSISLGDVASGGFRSWIARYEKGWMASNNLAKVYPKLGHGITSRGLQELKCCFLGPHGQFFAKWQDGQHLYSSPVDIPKILDGQIGVVSVAFGYEGTYFVAYTAPGDKNLYRYDLGNHYGDLAYFLNNERRKIVVLSITLDPRNGTDYILVYNERIQHTLKTEFKGPKVRFQSSGPNASAISSFW